jgi:hypothetical protein
VSRGEWNNDDASAPAFDLGGSDDRFFGVIAALYNNVRPEALHQIQGSVFRENDDQIDAFQRCEHISPLGIAANRTSRPLEPANRLVAVNADNKRVRGLSRSEQHVDVACVKQVEHAVGERNPALVLRSPALRLNPRRNLPGGIARRQSLLAARG